MKSSLKVLYGTVQPKMVLLWHCKGHFCFFRDVGFVVHVRYIQYISGLKWHCVQTTNRTPAFQPFKFWSSHHVKPKWAHPLRPSNTLLLSSSIHITVVFFIQIDRSLSRDLECNDALFSVNNTGLCTSVARNYPLGLLHPTWLITWRLY